MKLFKTLMSIKKIFKKHFKEKYFNIKKKKPELLLVVDDKS